MTESAKAGFGSELKKKLKEWGILVGLYLLRWLVEYLTRRQGNPKNDGSE